MNFVLRAAPDSNPWRVALKTSMAALVLALGVAMIRPAQSEAQQLSCKHCVQTQTIRNGEVVWVHWFLLNSPLCDYFPNAESCRACGGASECHGTENTTDVILGKCHNPCTPAFALRDLDRAVTRLAANLDAQNGAILAGKVAGEVSLTYDAPGNAVELIGCEGVVKRWTLAESARSYFADHVERITVDLAQSL